MNILNLPKRVSVYFQNKKTLAKNPRHNDTYIVEFPKSGITWLSTIIANAALIQSGREEIANFASTRTHIPDIHINRNIGPPAFTTPSVRFIKSHAERNDNYGVVIYLVRKPLSVLTSYYRYLNDRNLNPYNDFDSFCKSDEYGAPSWKRHVKSWLDAPAMGRFIHVIRYEDMLADTRKEIQLLNQNFGWGLGDTAINLAIQRSTAEEMRMSENLFASRNPRYKGVFVKGKDDIIVDDQTISYINHLCFDELRLAGFM